MRMKRTTIGASLVILLLSGPFVLGAAPPAARFQRGSSYALVAGTVFRDTGFALPNAEIVLTAKVLPEGVKKFKPLRAFSDARGEFAFRLPPARAEYTLTVKADGYQSAQRDVQVSADERADVFLELKPAAAEKK